MWMFKLRRHHEISPVLFAIEKIGTCCSRTNPRCFSKKNSSCVPPADGGRSNGWVGCNSRWSGMTKGHIWHDIDIFEICAWDFSWGPVTRAVMSNKWWSIGYGLIILYYIIWEKRKQVLAFCVVFRVLLYFALQSVGCSEFLPWCCLVLTKVFYVFTLWKALYK